MHCYENMIILCLAYFNLIILVVGIELFNFPISNGLFLGRWDGATTIIPMSQ